MDAARYETRIAGPVQGLVQGEHNVVTLIFQGDERRTVPFLAPLRPSDGLVGRAELLHDLKQRLFVGGSLALLNGLPGVGKTALALELAHDHDVLGHFHDGVLWAGLGRQPDVLAHLGVWAAAVGMPAHDLARLTSVEARAQALHAAIGMRRMLLVADDAWQVEAALAFKVGGPNCAHLLTTRLSAIALDFTDDQPMVVPELSVAEGLLLLERLAPGVVQAEAAEAKVLVQAVGGLPLALTVLGKYLRKVAHSGQPRRLRTALERLRQATERLELAQPQPPLEAHPSLPQGASISLQAAIGISDNALDETSRRALQALAVFPPKPNTFSEAAALEVTTSSVETLDTLTDYGLLESNGVGRYTLHQTIADYAQVRLTDQTAYERLVMYFVGYVASHHMDYSALDLEISNVLAAWQVAFDRGMPDALVQGANAFFHFMETRGLYTQARGHLHRAQEAARAGGDTVGLMTALGHLGRIAVNDGDYARAEGHFQEGLALAYACDVRECISALLRGLGTVAERRGNYAQAETYFQESLTLAREVGDREHISLLLQNLGVVAGNHSNYAQAEAYFRESLALARALDDRERLSILLQHLGVVAGNHGDYATAEAYFQEGLALARELGHRRRISDLLTHLGSVALRREDYAQAEAFYQEGLALAQQMGYREAVSFLSANLGGVARRRGDYAQAQACLQEGLALARELGHRWYIGCILRELGELHLDQQDLDAASVTFHEVQEVAQQVGVQEFVASAAYGLARVAEAQGNIVAARRQG
jgi:tetratricopeptide (TPR) repeat protein